MLKKSVLTIIILFATMFTNSKNISSIIAHTIRLQPHQDVKQALQDYVIQHNIKAASLITCVGSAEQVCLRYANQSASDTLIGKYEIVSLVGTLGATSGSHLHISISDSTGQTIGGHLQNGTLVYTTAEIVLAELKNVQYSREVDSTYGYKELKVSKK
jgi:uncharacterized protein